MTALHLAASAGNTAVIAVLLENKANVNAQAVNGKTPLMYAVEKSNTNSTLLLLENGANALARDAVSLIDIIIFLLLRLNSYELFEFIA